jgi:2',3'-cyclic-nucleotide 2'-phosphodiesterase (5'-nucleotidase family)
VVVSGHTHQAYNCILDARVVTSASSFGRVVTDIDLTIDPGTGDVTAARARNVSSAATWPRTWQTAPTGPSPRRLPIASERPVAPRAARDAIALLPSCTK